MTKLGERLIAAAEVALAHSRGEDVGVTEETYIVNDEIDVKAIRKGLDMTQSEFASFYGFNVAAIRSWEQGYRKPSRSSRILLKVIEKRPEVIPEIFAGDAVLVKPRKSKTRRARRADVQKHESQRI